MGTETAARRSTAGRGFGLLSEPRIAALALGAAILVSAAVVLHTNAQQTFVVDELFYYGRVAARGGGVVHYPSPFQPEYLLSPFLGHLALGGRLTYETVFATIGADYTVFVLLDIAGIAASIVLLFLLIRRRLGLPAALAPCLLLLFFGFAREQFTWPLDFNSAFALAAGLGAVTALARGSRRGDVLACALLTISVAMIEVGLAFAAGMAVMILVGGSRWRRIWIVLVPGILYAAWWLWSTARFGHADTSLTHLVTYPEVILESLGGTMGSLSGTNPVEPGVNAGPVTWFGRGLALVALVALALRIRRGSLPLTFWAWLSTLAAYWLLLAIADKSGQGTRYMLVNAVLVTLIAADAVLRPLSTRATVVLFALVLLALPANIDKLVSARPLETFHSDAVSTRIDYGMVELARDHVDPGYVVSSDPRVAAAGGGLLLGLPAEAILDAAEQNGSIAYPLDELRRKPERWRALADAALAGALGVELGTGRPAAGLRCGTFRVGPGGEAELALPAAPTFLRARGGRPLRLGLRRFASAGAGVPIGSLQPGRWSSLRIPAVALRRPWIAVVQGPVESCSSE